MVAGAPAALRVIADVSAAPHVAHEKTIVRETPPSSAVEVPAATVRLVDIGIRIAAKFLGRPLKLGNSLLS